MENGKNKGVKFFRTKVFFWDTLLYSQLFIKRMVQFSLRVLEPEPLHNIKQTRSSNKLILAVNICIDLMIGIHRLDSATTIDVVPRDEQEFYCEHFNTTIMKVIPLEKHYCLLGVDYKR